MSHLDAPLRSRRHSDPPPIDNALRRRKATLHNANDTHDYAQNAPESSSRTGAPFAARAPLKTLLLPAQLELRRVAATRPDIVALRAAQPSGPRHYATDPTFRLHALVARQAGGSTGQSTADAIEELVSSIGASTDCGAVAATYSGSLSTGQVAAVCSRRRAAVIRAADAAQSAASASASASSSRAAASTSRAIASSSRAAASSSRSSAAAASSSRSSAASSRRSASAAAARTTSTTSPRIRTTTRPAVTPRIAAPITTPLNPSQASSSRLAALESFVSSQFDEAASVVSSRAAAASSSRAALQSSVDSLFSSALVVVSSRRASATALSTVPSTTASLSSLASSTSSASSASSTTPASSSANPSSTSSGADPSATAAPASGDNNRIAKIVGPSVAIPLGLLLLALLAFLFLRRRRRKNAATGPLSGRSTPGIGPISNPQPMQAAPRQYGAIAQYGPDAGWGGRAGGAAGAGAGMGAAAAAGGAAAGAATVGAARGNNDSQESVGTTPSAIGVAFSEPRTKWGRRSLVDVLAGGVRSANSGNNSPSDSANRGVSGTSSFGGRQPSITSLAASGSIPSEYRGVGGYNSFSYQPGQMRPVMTPLGAHYDPFGPTPSIVPVPVSAQRHPHPVSSEEGSISGYGSSHGSGSGSAEDDVPRQYHPGGSGSVGSASAASGATHPGYPYLAPVRGPAGQSRTTQTTGEEGYYTADPGVSSHDEHETETLEEVGLRDFGVEDSPEEASVNFGRGSSGSGGSGSAGRPSFVGSARRSFDDPMGTPRLGSGTSTPRLGTGHGSLGNRRNDGTGSWWN